MTAEAVICVGCQSQSTSNRMGFGTLLQADGDRCTVPAPSPYRAGLGLGWSGPEPGWGCTRAGVKYVVMSVENQCQ